MRAVAFLMLWMGSCAIADTRLHYVSGDGEQQRTVVMQLSQGQLRTDLDDQGYTVWNRSAGTFTHVMHKRQQYLTIDQATVTQLMQMASGFMAMMNQSDADLEKAKREVAKPRELLDTGRKERVGQFDCEVFTVLENGAPTAELCLTATAALALSEDDLATFLSLAEFGQSLANSLLGKQMARPPEWLTSVAAERFPIKYSRLEAGGKITDMALVSISHDAVPATEFEPPEGYQLMQMPLRFSRP